MTVRKATQSRSDPAFIKDAPEFITHHSCARSHVRHVLPIRLPIGRTFLLCMNLAGTILMRPRRTRQTPGSTWGVALRGVALARPHDVAWLAGCAQGVAAGAAKLGLERAAWLLAAQAGSGLCRAAQRARCDSGAPRDDPRPRRRPGDMCTAVYATFAHAHRRCPH